MTRERAKELAPIISAYAEGKTIQLKGAYGWVSFSFEPSFDENTEYRLKPEPRMRPMTRGEVLYKVTTTPGMVVRLDGQGIELATNNNYYNAISRYEWAIIDASGNTGEWHKFEVEEE